MCDLEQHCEDHLADRLFFQQMMQDDLENRVEILREIGQKIAHLSVKQALPQTTNVVCSVN